MVAEENRPVRQLRAEQELIHRTHARLVEDDVVEPSVLLDLALYDAVAEQTDASPGVDAAQALSPGCHEAVDRLAFRDPVALRHIGCDAVDVVAEAEQRQVRKATADIVNRRV
ncbi:hypothetical protein SDC9_192084 [bioreactor metagenome]|uniref:Uncharacterized protein n=1 Tax=bioreactor metagenome TaxID=1076179 RepID=A0A645I276_9ZZZZ